MTTQYSPILKLALPVQGELSGTWGDVVNDNITSMVEQAIAGRAVINTWSTNSHTLTSANGTTSESRCAMLELTDTGTSLSAAGTVICPALSKIYIVKNAAGQNITVKTASGTGILVPNGRTTFLFCDGTNVVEAMTHTTSLQLGTSTTVTAVLDEDNMASNSATSLATQQSIKAYVDAQVGAFDSLAEVLAVGNTTGGTDLAVSTGDDITFADSSKAIFGAGSDLQIYHDGSNSFIKDTGTGSLYIQGQQAIILANADATEFYATFDVNGASTLRYDNGQKLATTSTGIDVTGNANFADNGKAVFGAGSDLQIYHDGSNSYIREDSVGSLRIQGADLELSNPSEIKWLKGYNNNRVEIFFNNNLKLATSSTGIDVTGTVTADGMQVSTSGNLTALLDSTSGTPKLQFRSSNGALSSYIQHGVGGTSNLSFQTNGTTERMAIEANGDISFYEDTGTTAKFFWDSSAESLGIGTSSPTALLHLSSTAPSILMQDSDGTGRSSINCDNGSLNLKFNSNNAVGTSVLTFSDFNTERMRIDASGNVGIGTSSPEANLHVQNGSAGSITTTNSQLLIENNTTARLTLLTPNVSGATIEFGDPEDQDAGRINYDHSGNFMRLYTAGAERMRIDSSGKVGIGTSSPSVSLDVLSSSDQVICNFAHPSASTDSVNGGALIKIQNTNATNGNQSSLIFADSASSASSGIFGFNTNHTTHEGYMVFGTRNSAGSFAERMRIDSSGNVGIGTSNPLAKLQIKTQANGNASFQNSTSVAGGVKINAFNDAGSASVPFEIDGSSLQFNIASVEKIRIDASGNLLVGKTSDNNAVAGTAISNSGIVKATRTDWSLLLNRLSTDGDIALFQKDGTTVGSIGSYLGAYAYIGSTGGTDTHIGFVNGTVRPATATGAALDATLDLGNSSSRFKDLYLSGNVTATGIYNSGIYNQTGDAQFWVTNVGEAVRIQQNTGNVGIGTSSPSEKLHVSGTGDRNIAVESTNTGSGANAGIKILAADGGDFLWQTGNATGNALRLYDLNANAEAMRIDSSGNLLVGKTSADFGSSVGFEANANDTVYVTRSGGASLTLNRTSSDGDIALFRKNGTTVGSIGASGGNTFIYGGSGSVANLNFGSTSVVYPSSDAVGDVGASSHRFRDAYLSGGVYLGGTGSANKLSDYEEGSFTPTFSSGFTSMSYQLQSGHYVKVGRLVTIQVQLKLNSATATGSIITIAGLPFNAAGYSDSTYGGFYPTYNASFNTNTGDVYHKNANNANINVYTNTGSGRTGISSGISTSAEIILSGSYYTNS